MKDPHPADSNSQRATLDAAFQAIEHWRKNKATYGANIPDEVWSKIFPLEETYSPSKIRQIFAISKQTYLSKRTELQGKKNVCQSQPAHNLSSGFSEAVINDMPSWLDETPRLTNMATTTKPLKKTDHDAYPASFLDLSTVVVEFIRADGQRMKIHTTDKSFRELMRVFFEEGGTGL